MRKLGAILHQSSPCVLNSKGVVLYMVGHGHQKRLRLPLLTFCGGHVKERGVGKRVIFFLKIHSSFFVVKCRGKLDGLAKQRWMFSLKQSADGAHSRGKLCKSLH